MTESTTPAEQQDPPCGWRWFFRRGVPRFVGLLGWCFFVALLYTLLAFPVMEYFGVATKLNGLPLFGENPFVSGQLGTLLFRCASAALVIAFFIVFGRWGVPIYMKGLSGRPSTLWLLFVLISPFIVVAIATMLFAAVIGWQQDEYSKALLQYVGFSLWPFAVVVPLAGILSGLAQPLPAGTEEPAVLQEDIELLKVKIQELVAWIEHSASVIDPFLQGNLLAATLAGVSFAAIVTAGISTDPSVAILLFALPMVKAFGDLPALYLTDKVRICLINNGDAAGCKKILFVLVALFLIPVFVALGIVITRLGFGVIDAIYGVEALQWREYGQFLVEAPFAQGLGVGLFVLSPAYWVLALVGRALFAPSE